MDPPTLTNVPHIEFSSHSRTPSHSPTRSPIRQRITEDILSDLSPASTLEAFTSDSPSGKLRASVEDATPSERAFGIRATLASKKIQEWVEELSAWPWPDAKAAAGGFELPAAKRIKLDPSLREDPDQEKEVYMGSLPARDVLAYERRIDEIHDDMEDLDVEGIKKYVLNTHFSPRSRPSSSASDVAPIPTSLLSYTKMDDFTAIVTATVLRALPYLSQLMRLMDVWSVRLSVLRKVPPLLGMLDDAENALKSGWQALQVQNHTAGGKEEILDRQTFETMRDVLQDIVTTLGQDLDYMLDTLEGRQDTLPDRWLDRMEAIETDYGEWVVSGDRKVREGEWARMAKRRIEEQEKKRAEEETARLEAERKRREVQERLRAEEEIREAAKLEAERVRKLEENRLIAEEEARKAARLEEERISKEAKDRLKAEEEAKEAARLESERIKEAEDNLEAEDSRRLAAETAKAEKEEQLKQEADALRIQAEQTRKRKEEALRLEQDAEALRLQEEYNPHLPDTESRNTDEDLQDAGTEQPTLSRLEFVDLPPHDNVCYDPDHEVEHNHGPSAIIPDLLIAAGVSSLAAALGMKNNDDGDVNEAMEDLSVPSPPISTFAPLDGNNDSKFEDANAFYDTNGKPSRVDNGIPLRVMQRDIQTPGAVSVSEEKASAPQSIPLSSIEATELVSPLSPKAVSDFGSPTELPISISKGVSEQMPSVPNPWEDQPRHPSPKSDVPSLDEGETPFDVSQAPLLDKAPSTPAKSTRRIPEVHDSNMPLAVTSIADEESVDPVTNEANIALEPRAETPKNQMHLHPEDHSVRSKGYNGNGSVISTISTVSGYSASDPSPEIYEAEPAEYFRPLPLRATSGTPTLIEISAKKLPLAPNHSYSGMKSSARVPGDTTGLETDVLDTEDDSDLNNANDESHGNSPRPIMLLEPEDHDSAVPAEKHSDPNHSINHIEISRRNSNSSNNTTVVTRLIGDSPSSPAPLSPASIAETLEPFPDVESPTAGRVGLRNQSSKDYSPPDSPPPIPSKSKRRSIHLLNGPNIIPSSPIDTPITPTSDDIPNFPSLEISPAPFSSPKKATTTDDQLQAQISTLLESIPARIRLTSEPAIDNHPLSPFSSSYNDTIRPNKTRRSLTPSIRSSSSMSMRAPTPSFTLAPAYSKSTPRPRHQSSNPEIKLYHLSRSTGEAPIKLFVRLVGENGERVMVRVGGGWADLGEYLREYASHHGRRVSSGKTDDDKVEIQDLPSRVVSNANTNNGAAVRGNERSSPAHPRPSSVLERDRPMSSLFIRKTRRSVGEQSESSTTIISPSTPLPVSPTRNSTLMSRNYDTPPSGQNRSASRMSWAEEEGGLGLAGPKSKPKPISERDQEWVESMKEKVRLASAEKEKLHNRKEGKADGGRKSLGEMEKVGGTKRLFKKN